jgi:hypothetical protein
MNIGCAKLFATATLLVYALCANGKPVMPPKGGAAILLKNPVWLTGISNSTDKIELAPYAKLFPASVRTEHFSVVNAGYWLANQSKPSQVFYEFALTIVKPFESRVFTRVMLENPAELDKPIKYEHYIDPSEKSTKATHGPLSRVKRGEKYSMTLEVFTDEARTVLLERVVQTLVAPLDNSDGCVDLQPEVMLSAMSGISSSKAPIDKIILACDR